MFNKIKGILLIEAKMIKYLPLGSLYIDLKVTYQELWINTATPLELDVWLENQFFSPHCCFQEISSDFEECVP